MEICQYILINMVSQIYQMEIFNHINKYGTEFRNFQYILINMVSQNLPHRNLSIHRIFPRIYHMEICQYILINMVSQNLPHGNLSIHINKYGIPEIYILINMEICQYILINMVSQNLPHRNLLNTY